MDEIGQKIMTHILECILQSRIDVQKKQIRHFDEINKRILNQDYKENHERNLRKFLDSMFLAEKYGLAGKIPKGDGYESATVVFRLVNKITGVITIAEIWLIEFQQFKQIDEESHEQEFETIISLIEDLIVFLNRQPLFSEYQSNPKMKNCFTLTYTLLIKSQQKSQKDKLSSNILMINRKHTRERVCHSFLIKLQCDFIDPLLECMTSSTSSQFHMKNEMKKQQIQTIDSETKNLVVSTKEKKKYNVYEFYDKDLDFVFLSSDDQTFKKSPKADVKEINIGSYIDDSDEFQLLIVSKDEEFLDDSKEIFKDLSSNETKYFHN